MSESWYVVVDVCFIIIVGFHMDDDDPLYFGTN